MTQATDRHGPGDGRGDGAQAAEYVLRLMDDAERAAFEEAMAASPDLRAEVAFWEAEFAGMAAAEVAPVAPSRGVRDRLMGRLFREPERTSPLMHPVLWQALTFASLALSAGLAWQLYTQPAAPPLFVGEIAAEDEARLRLLAVYDGADGTLRLARTDGVAAPGRALELWAIAGQDSPPVSLGLLSAEAEGIVELPEALQDDADSLLFAISDEPAGGSPTGQPTGDVVALGQLTGL